MADRPPPPGLNPAALAALAEHAAGRLSAEVALMRLMLSGLPAHAVPAAVAGAPALAALAARHAAGLATLERLVRAGAEHRPAASADAALDDARAMFDRLVAVSPEASVAAYSLGDPAVLARATAELLEWLRGLGLLDGRPRVLDFGCGIGRVATAVAAEAEAVLGLDLSPGMVAAARARHSGVPGLSFATCSGRDLAGLPDARFGLVLAVDVFPYLVQGGAALAGGMLAEAARVLRPGGALAILNYSYGDPAGDAAALAAVAPALGLVLEAARERPLALWDGIAFRLRRGEQA
jgi:SAM-dependent methyltransferase